MSPPCLYPGGWKVELHEMERKGRGERWVSLMLFLPKLPGVALLWYGTGQRRIQFTSSAHGAVRL